MGKLIRLLYIYVYDKALRMILCGRFQQFFILQTPCKHLHQHPCVSGTLLQHAYSLVMSCCGLPSAVVIDLVGDPRFSLALYSQKQNAWPDMMRYLSYFCHEILTIRFFQSPRYSLQIEIGVPQDLWRPKPRQRFLYKSIVMVLNFWCFHIRDLTDFWYIWFEIFRKKVLDKSGKLSLSQTFHETLPYFETFWIYPDILTYPLPNVLLKIFFSFPNSLGW